MIELLGLLMIIAIPLGFWQFAQICWYLLLWIFRRDALRRRKIIIQLTKKRVKHMTDAEIERELFQLQKLEEIQKSIAKHR